jgi:ribosome biogenesis GTPase A
MESAPKVAKNKKRVLKTFLTVGPTRMGKSSLINALA